uniref:Uncharacterized protein n=1 Tax=Oryza barthii TaxID=65489 RepID=A0A0D3G5C2_9ORYZ
METRGKKRKREHELLAIPSSPARVQSPWIHLPPCIRAHKLESCEDSCDSYTSNASTAKVATTMS